MTRETYAITSIEIAHVLDNAVWASLATHHARFAIRNGQAARYLPDISPITATANTTISAAVLDDLAGIVAKGEPILVGGDILPPDAVGWTVRGQGVVLQMVSDHPIDEGETGETLVDLNASDVPEIRDLIKLTEPGPFEQRTIELGHYIGIHKEGRLVAMAGERLHLPGYREISAVCTHPDFQGKGYAGLLVSRLVNENWQRGDVPFLHVGSTNMRARELYERLHFRLRREFPILIISY